MGINKERLKEKAVKYGIELNSELLEQLNAYACLLIDWNKKINLTAITDEEDIENKHFIDSLLFAIQPEVQGTVADVGSGAGFPGIVTAIYKPELKISLIEPTGKRVKFLNEAINMLKIKAVAVKERAEEAARKEWRQSFNTVTARAVAALPALCEYCLPLVKIGGYFIAMKGQDSDEISKAANAIDKLGGKFIEQRDYLLPDNSKRTLILIKKIKDTPEVYPRNGGVIAKRPL